MNYSDFILVDKNPNTGLSKAFDKGYYNIEETYKYQLPIPMPQNRILSTLHKEIMSLLAYGLGPTKTSDVLSVYNPAFKSLNRGAYKTYMNKCCYYYSYHISELKKLIGHYDSLAEQLIDYYIHNKDKNVVYDAYNTNPINKETVIEDIRTLLEKLLLYANAEISEELNIKELKEEENKIKQDLVNCHDVELVNDYYAKLISNLNKQNEYRKNSSKDHLQAKAVRVLKGSGFVDAAYKWLACFPKK